MLHQVNSSEDLAANEDADTNEGTKRTRCKYVSQKHLPKNKVVQTKKVDNLIRMTHVLALPSVHLQNRKCLNVMNICLIQIVS